MRRTIVVAALTCALAAVPSRADAKSWKYRSKHPLPPAVGGFCDVDGPHIHDFGPHDRRLFRVVAGAHYFVGDPTPFGYEGPRHAYYDPHPVLAADLQAEGPLYCYLEGPHYHWYQPTASVHFAFSGGAYFFVGTFDPLFVRHRPRYAVINHVYRPIRYARPVVDVAAAPPGWRGRRVPPGQAKRAAAPPPPAVSVHLGVGLQMGGPAQKWKGAPQAKGRGGPPAKWRGGPPPGHGKHGKGR